MMDIDYSQARPNHNAIFNYLVDMDVDFKDVADSLMAWLPDDEVKEWAQANDFYWIL